MIPGSRGGPARPLRAAVALASLVVAAAVACLAPAASAATATAVPTAPRGAVSSWEPAWSWRSGDGPLPAGCAPYAGRSSSGVRWSPELVRQGDGPLRLATRPAAGTRHAAGSGIGCTGLAQRYGRYEVRARIPRGQGLVGRIALWPAARSGGSDWSGLTVPSADLSPAYVTNGCGDEAFGAALPAGLAGAFHRYVITWTPRGFTVEVDGRRLYADTGAFDGPRWPGISLAATGPAAPGAQLVVSEIVVQRWTGPGTSSPPGVSGAAGGASPGATTLTPGADDGGTRAPAGQGPGTGEGLAVSGPAPGGTTGPTDGGTTGGTAGSTPGGTGRGTPTGTAAVGTDALAVALGADLGMPWLVGGGCVAIGVLAGVARAAMASRRRPVPLR